MTDMMLYACTVPERGQAESGAAVSVNQSIQGVLGSSTGSVDQIATVPGDQTFRVQYVSPLAEKLVTELDELARASDIDEVPFHGVDASTSKDGYYTISRTDAGALDPHSTHFQEFEGTLSFVGTRASHRRSVGTDINQADHPFGNEQTALVGTPATATKVQWFDKETGETDEPTLVATRTGEHRDVEVYDARDTDLSVDNPTLIYDLPYEERAWADPRAWDDRGNADRTDENGGVLWQKVFATDHDFQGQAILSNGLVRLVIDEDNQSLEAERWDDGNDEWSTVSLGSSDWELFDFDLRRVGLASMHAIVEFRDTTASPTEYYSLNCWVKRGWEDPLWGEIDGQGGTPQGLEALLTPIASGSDYEPGEDLGLVNREDY